MFFVVGVEVAKAGRASDKLILGISFCPSDIEGTLKYHTEIKFSRFLESQSLEIYLGLHFKIPAFCISYKMSYLELSPKLLGT